MCNLSTGIEEKATEKTSEKFILNMYKKGYGSKKQGRDRAAHGRPALPLIPNLNPNS